MTKPRLPWVVAALFALTIASQAADGEPQIDKADTAWMLVSAALVLFMTPGLAFFYGGLVRTKNFLSVLMQCFTCMGLMTLLWILVGYSLAFGGGGGFIGNFDHVFLRGVGYGPGTAEIPEMLFMMFQGMFAVITPALIVGAFAERMKFIPFCVFSSLWLLLVYCPVCHWVWANPDGYEGFFALGNDGALDFAGGTVVHINAGIAALCACIVLGKRQGFPTRISPPHNLPFAALGAGMLWFGWFGFNAGSALAADGSAVNALVVTHVAAGLGGIAWAALERFHVGKPTVLGVITGAVAGLVSITPACGSVGPMGAIFVGIGGSVVAYPMVAIVKAKLGYDDTLDVWGVHGMAGMWGAVAAGLFATAAVPGNDANGLITAMMTDGIAIGDGMHQLLVQFKAVFYTLIYSGVVSFVLLKLVDVTMGLRVGADAEKVGLDMSEHAEHAYTLLD